MTDDPRPCRPPNHYRLLYGLAFHLLCRLAISRPAPSHVPAHWPSDLLSLKAAAPSGRRLAAWTLPSLQTSAWTGGQAGEGAGRSAGLQT